MPDRDITGTINVPARARGERDGDNAVRLPVPRRLADRVRRIVVHADGRVHVYARVPVRGATFRWGEHTCALAWNGDRLPNRAEGQLPVSD